MLLQQTLKAANLNPNRARVEPDPDDPDRQSLLLWYPTATAEGNAYIRRAIKMESGTKSADRKVMGVQVPHLAPNSIKTLQISLPKQTIMKNSLVPLLVSLCSEFATAHSRGKFPRPKNEAFLKKCRAQTSGEFGLRSMESSIGKSWGRARTQSSSARFVKRTFSAA